MEEKTVYFICTGNSVRSQMAEGFARHYGGDRIRAFSGGVEAYGVNRIAVLVMSECGVDISHQTSDVIDEVLLEEADVVVTLCGNARDRCPATPPGVRKLHWDIADPAQIAGSEDEVLDGFRDIRDEIRLRVKELVDLLLSGS